MLIAIPVRAVNQLATEATDASLDANRFVDERAREAPATTIEEPELPVGIPIGGPDLATEIVRDARDAVTGARQRVARRRAQSFDLRPQRRGYFLIRVERKHDVVPRRVDREVLLRRETIERSRQHSGPESLGAGRRVVARTAIHHHHVVAERDAAQRGLDPIRLVLGDEDGGDLRHEDDDIDPVRPWGSPRLGGLPVNRTFRDSISLLRTRTFGTFWVASLLSSIGTWAQQVAQPWLLLTLGASSFLVGLDSFAMNAPVWLLTLVGGVLADRADRRRIIATFQSIQMACPTLIAVLLVTGGLKPWMVIVCSLVVGVTDALSMPSFQSIVPTIVRHDQIDQGLALNSTQFNLSRILGPSIAGVLMSSVGLVACFALSALSYIPFIGVALWVLPRWSPPVSVPNGKARPRESPFRGLGAILREPRLRGALLTVLTTSMLCAPLMTFTPVLVKTVFLGDAARFSLAVASFGVGGLMGASLLLGVPPSVNRRRLSSACGLLYAVVVIGAALVPSFWGLPPLLVLAGAAMTMSNTSANTILQRTADRRFLGKTVSLYMLAMQGGMSLGALLTGLSVSLIGVKEALLLNGSVALLVHSIVATVWSRSPEPEAFGPQAIRSGGPR